MTETKFIMEIGSNHNQTYSRLEKMINEAKELGFWAIKLQLFDPNKLYYNPSKDKLNELKQQTLPIIWLPLIKSICIDLDLKFICTPFYNEAIDILRPFVDCYKISSFDTLRIKLIEDCIKTKKMVFISNGLIHPMGLFYLYSILSKDSKKILNRIVTMYCISKYPANLLDFYIKELEYLKLYGTKTGYSDHIVSPGVLINCILHNIDYIELHYDLMDGEGFESKYNHCWNYNKIKEVNNLLSKTITELKDEYCFDTNRNNKADPNDGLRPMKIFREEK